MDEREQQRTFDDWVATHKGLLFKVVRAYAFNAHDRDDLFQKVITQVWTSVPRFRAESAVTAWLYRVALNTALAWSRRERKHRDRMQSLDGVGSPLQETSRASDRRLHWLYDQIAQFDHVDRSLTLLLLDDLRYRDMATTLGITESHVGVVLLRLRDASLANLAGSGLIMVLALAVSVWCQHRASTRRYEPHRRELETLRAKLADPHQ